MYIMHDVHIKIKYYSVRIFITVYMYLFRIMSTENTSYKEKLSLILIKLYSWEKVYKHMQSYVK